jgi:hypothetical protein
MRHDAEGVAAEASRSPLQAETGKEQAMDYDCGHQVAFDMEMATGLDRMRDIGTKGLVRQPVNVVGMMAQETRLGSDFADAGTTGRETQLEHTAGSSLEARETQLVNNGHNS